jgi:DMSO/TMAO reductase YedYZ molybdopterin-dependent catalytic subunit
VHPVTTSLARTPQRLSVAGAPPGAIVEAAAPAALGLDPMPSETHFQRDHFGVPDLDPGTWTLDVGGAAHRALALTIDDLERLPRVSLAVVLECAGHRRAEFDPPARGIPWGIGAVGEAVWTGARLRDVLGIAEPQGATHVVLEGADAGRTSENGHTTPFARALPLEKALHDDTLLAWEMNGAPLPAAHGAPLRAIVPGWYATDSVKWLTRITLAAGPFDGHFEVNDYRVRDNRDPGGRRLTNLPVSSLLTSRADGAVVPAGETELRGIAWCGDAQVARVEVSIDDGGWRLARLRHPGRPYARAFWTLPWRAEPGDHVVRVRATDERGRSQPDRPRWNERGFANASIHRVRLTVSA